MLLERGSHPLRRRCGGHRAAEPEGQGRNRRHLRRWLDRDRIHRRHLRRNHRSADVAGRGRRDRIQRLQFPQSRRADRRSTGGAPHPRSQHHSGPPAGDSVRRVALLRAFHHHHHHRCRCRDRRQDPLGAPSSSRSMATSKTAPWLICFRDASTPTPPDWCWPSSRSTPPGPRPPSPGQCWPSRAPRPSAARSSPVPARIASSARRLGLHLPWD